MFLRKHVPKTVKEAILTHLRLQIGKECSTISLGIRNKLLQAMKSPVSFTSTSTDFQGKRTSTGSPQAQSHLATAQCFLQTHQLSAEWPGVQLQRILSFSCTCGFSYKWPTSTILMGMTLQLTPLEFSGGPTDTDDPSQEKGRSV